MNKSVFLILIFTIFLIGFILAIEHDADNDGILSDSDNCPIDYNPSQSDADEDGIGDLCDNSPGIVIPEEGDIVINNTNITEPICGNNILEEGESCDYGTSNGVVCDNFQSNCTYCNSFCVLIELNPKISTSSGYNSNYQWTWFCEPNWKCTSWSECSDGIKFRKCLDKNYCNLDYNKPIENAGCEKSYSVLIEEKQSEINWLLVLLIIFLFLIILLISLLIKAK